MVNILPSGCALQDLKVFNSPRNNLKNSSNVLIVSDLCSIWNISAHCLYFVQSPNRDLALNEMLYTGKRSQYWLLMLSSACRPGVIALHQCSETGPLTVTSCCPLISITLISPFCLSPYSYSALVLFVSCTLFMDPNFYGLSLAPTVFMSLYQLLLRIGNSLGNIFAERKMFLWLVWNCCSNFIRQTQQSPKLLINIYKLQAVTGLVQWTDHFWRH